MNGQMVISSVANLVTVSRSGNILIAFNDVLFCLSFFFKRLVKHLAFWADVSNCPALGTTLQLTSQLMIIQVERASSADSPAATCKA